MDYFLFILGFLFFGLGTSLYLFAEQRKRWIKVDYLIFFIIYMWIIGSSIWSDNLFHVFPQVSIYGEIHHVLYFLAYISLFEFGRRMLFENRKYSFLLYLLSILLIFIDDSLLLVRNYFAVLGSAFSGIAFIRLRKEFNKSKENSFSSFILPFSYFLLSFLYLLFMIVHLVDTIYFSDYIHWLKHSLEWGMVISISSIFLFQIIQVEIQDPIEIQLKHIKIQRFKRYIKTFLIISIIGFGLVHYLGKISWAQQRAEILNIVGVAALSIDGDVHQQLKGTHEEEKGIVYQQIKNKLENIKTQIPSVTYIYTMYLKGDQILFGVDPDAVPEEEGDHCGDIYYEATPMMFDMYTKEDTMVEETITSDRWGDWLSAYAPITNSEGKIIALLGMDISANHILNKIRITRFIGMTGLFVIFLINIGFSYIAYLHHKEKLWRTYHTTILSSIGDMVIVFDKNQKIIFVNKAIFSLTGYSLENIGTDYTLNQVLNTGDEKRFHRIMKNLKNDKVHFSEFHLLTTEDKRIPVYISLTFLQNDRKDPLYVLTAMNITEQKKREEEIERHYQETLSLLATVVDAKDDYTARHSNDVTYYAKVIAEELGFSDEIIREIQTAAMVHDIGKIAIPDNILKKEGPLTDEEWHIMREHPVYGKQILEKAGGIFNQLIPYVYHHHERYDGKGYPSGMEQPPIPICIITVADAFDAMVSDRAYRKGLTLEQAKNELIRHSGTQFHPEVVQAFLRILERDIELDDKEALL